MTARPPHRSRTHGVRGRTGTSPPPAPAAHSAPPPGHGGGALRRAKPPSPKDATTQQPELPHATTIALTGPNV
jgi:hypothetical protein